MAYVRPACQSVFKTSPLERTPSEVPDTSLRMGSDFATALLQVYEIAFRTSKDKNILKVAIIRKGSPL